jgi:hypothetical protein
MPFVFFGFVSVMLVWLFFAVVWAAALLFWPITLLIAGAIIWRARPRTEERFGGPVIEGKIHRGPAPVVRREGRLGAFEEYKRETMARLDEESAKFREYLDSKRRSRDKQEFDAYMSARRGGPREIAGGDASTA